MPIPPFDEFVLLHNNICRAVNDPRRLQILYALAEHPRNVTSLAEAVEAPQPTVSRHLNVLRQRHLVAATRDGASVIYRLSDMRIIDVLETMRQVLRDSLDRQQTLVD